MSGKKKIGRASITVVPELDTKKAQKELDELTKPKEVKIVPKVNFKSVADQLQAALEKDNKTVQDAFNVQGLMSQMQAGISTMRKAEAAAWQATLDDFEKQFKGANFQLGDGSSLAYEAAVAEGARAKALEESAKATKKLAQANDDLARSQEKVKLSRIKATIEQVDSRGKPVKYVPGQYTAMDGRYLIQEGGEGWNIYDQKNDSNLSDMIASCRDLADVRKYIAECMADEAKTMQNNATATQEQTDVIKMQTEAVDARTAAEERLQAAQKNSVLIARQKISAINQEIRANIDSGKIPSFERVTTTANEVYDKTFSGDVDIAQFEARAHMVQERMKVILDLRKQISSMASVKDIPLEDTYTEAAKVGQMLATMYDEGITDTEEYIALQYKLANLFERYEKSGGGVKGWGARDAIEMRHMIQSNLLQDTGFDIWQSGVWDILYTRGNSIYEENGKKRKMLDVVADLVRYRHEDGGRNGASALQFDESELSFIQDIVAASVKVDDTAANAYKRLEELGVKAEEVMDSNKNTLIAQEAQLNDIYKERINIFENIGRAKLEAYDATAYAYEERANEELLGTIEMLHEDMDSDRIDYIFDNFAYYGDNFPSVGELQKLLADRELHMQGFFSTDYDSYDALEQENAAIRERIALMQELQPILDKGIITQDQYNDMLLERGQLEERTYMLAGLQQDVNNAIFDKDDPGYEGFEENLNLAQAALDVYEKILVTTASGKKLELGPNMSGEDYKSFLRMTPEAAKSVEFVRKEFEQIVPELLNISNALMTGAAKAADIRYHIEDGTLNDIGAVSTILKGVDLLKTARGSGRNIEEYLSQSSLFGLDYSAEDVAIGKFLEANVRNAANLRNMIDTILDFARSAGDPNQISFDGLGEVSLSDIIRNAFAKYAEKYQKSINYDELVSGYLPAEAGSRSDKRVDRTAVEVPVEPVVEQGAVKEKIAESINGTSVEVPVTPVVSPENTKENFWLETFGSMFGDGDDKDAIEPILSVANENAKMIELISSAAGKSAATKFLEGITSETDLKERISGYFNEVLKGDDWKFKEGKGALSIQGDTLTAHLVNSYQDALHAVFKLDNGVLEPQANSLRLDIANITDSFDVEGMQARALAAVEKLRTGLHGLEYDLSDLQAMAENITSKDAWNKFANQYKAAQDSIQALKNTMVSKSTMNQLANMQRDMRNANIEIETMRLNVDKLGDIDGVNKATEAINEMKAAVESFNKAETAEEQQKAYSKYSEQRNVFQAQYRYLSESKHSHDQDQRDLEHLLNLQVKLFAIEKDLIALEAKGDTTSSKALAGQREAQATREQIAEYRELLKTKKELIAQADTQQDKLDTELNQFTKEQKVNSLLTQRVAINKRLEKLERARSSISGEKTLAELERRISEAKAEKDEINAEIKSHDRFMKSGAVAEQDKKFKDQSIMIGDAHALKVAKELEKVTANVSNNIKEMQNSGDFDLLPKKLRNEINQFQTNLENMDVASTTLPGLKEIEAKWSDINNRVKEYVDRQKESVNNRYKNFYQSDYGYGSEKTAADQMELDRMAEYYRAEEEKAKQHDKNIKSVYQSLLGTIEEINKIDSKMNKLSLQDGGSGLYAGMLKNLQTQKSYLVSYLRSLGDEIQDSLSITPVGGQSVLNAFFNDARVQATLTAEEIQKINEALIQTENIRFEFGAKINEQIQPVIEKVQSLKTLVKDGIIAQDSGAAKNILSIDSEIANKYNAFKADGSQAAALDLLKYIDSITKYINILDKAAQKEKEYFSGKTKYTQDTSMDNMANDTEKAVQKTVESQKKLEEAAKAFAGSNALITNFTHGADGISKLDFSIFDTATNSMRNFRMEMGSVTEGMYVTETTVNKSLSSIKAAQKQLQSVGSLIGRLGESGVDVNPNTATGSIAKLLSLYQQLQAEVNKGDNANQNLIAKLTKDAKISAAEVEKLYKLMVQMLNAIDNGDAKPIGNVNLSGDKYRQMIEQVKAFATEQGKGVLQIGKFNEAAGTLDFTISNADGTVNTFRATMNGLNGQVVAQKTGVKQLGTIWDSFRGSIAKVGKQFTTALFGANIFYKAISEVRKGIGYIREIDIAMTELRKVTNETEKSYEEFLKTASSTAGLIGSTVSDFTAATANFARLGYTMSESAQMAESAIVYKNVADGLDTVDEATDSIISTMKAFGIESNDTMGIIDRFNEVGNSFAITSAGIGDALTRSASALYEAGNTIDESIGLVTAANSVIQNPEQVGTALKTLALRLRGAKVELQEASLDADNMAESTSQLQQKLLALTGGKVDIMLDADTFKSTTQILREMSEAWDSMNDIDRAAALELMGGKRQANILASVIKNFDIVEDAIATSMDSAGSALAENEKYLDSIEGKIQTFTNSLQTMWMNILNSDFIKSVVDAGTILIQTIIKIQESIGTIPAILAAITGYNLGKTLLSWASASVNVAAATGALSAAEKVLEESKEGAAKAAAEKAVTQAAENLVTAQNTKENIKNALSVQTLKKAFVSFIKSPIGIASAVATVTAITVGLVLKMKQAQKDAAKSAAQYAEEVANTNKQLSDYKEQINSLRKALDSGNLSEQEAYDKRKQLISIQDELISKYGKEAEGINLVTGAIETQIDAIDELAKKNAEDWLNKNSQSTKWGPFKFTSPIEDAIKTVESEFDTTASFGTKVWTDAFKDAYGDDWKKFNKEAGQEYQQFVESLGGKLNLKSNSITFSNVTRDELADYYDQITNWLREYASKNGLDFNELIGKVQDSKTTAIGDDYDTHKENYEAYLENTAIAEYTDVYGNILDAQDEFYHASTDKDKLAKIQDYNQKVVDAFIEAGGLINSNGELIVDKNSGNASMQQYFKDMQAEFADEEFELKVKTNEDSLREELENIIKESGEQGLSSLDDTAVKDMVSRGLNVEGAKDVSGKYTEEQINGLVKLQAEADKAGISIESLINILTNLGLIAGDPANKVAASINAVGKAYSTLAASTEKYTNINDILNESIYDRVELSQEQYDAINELIGSEKAFSDCIDTTNGYVVKNAALIRKLVAEKKKEQKATIQQAKSYSKLQYQATVKQIQQLVKSMENEVRANGRVNASTMDTIDTLREQLDVLKQTTQQYALLELKLSDAAQAYTEFEAAQARDAELAYGDSMVEMLQAINEGFKTGQVGSEAFQAAVKALVPESVYKDIDDVQERLKTIHDYIDQNPVFADYFTIDDGDISITMDNIKAFIHDGLDDGIGKDFSVFTGTIEDFDLSSNIKSIEDLANAYGITEAAALAMLTEFEKYDASWGNIIDQLATSPIDRKIDEQTDALEKALDAQEEFIKSGQPLYDENGKMTDGYKRVVDAVNHARDGLDNATNAAADNAAAYARTQAVLKGMSGEIKYTQEQADALAQSLGLVDENGNPHIKINDDGSLALTQSQADVLNKTLKELGSKPTMLDVQLAYDKIDSQIKELQAYLNDPKNYNGTILAELDITNEEEAEAKVEELTANRDAIQLVYNITANSSEQDSSTIEKLTTWETNGINITITGDTTDIKGAVDEANALETTDKEAEIAVDPESIDEFNDDINTANNNNIDDKKPGIYMQGISTAIRDINSIGDAIEDLPSDAKVTISVGYNGPGKADGNFHISGGAFAGGSVGAPRNETALVGELGPELLVRNGRWTTVGDNGAEFTQVKKGDIIFNHKQTEQLLKNGYITGRGKAYASGTAYFGGFSIFEDYIGDGDAFKDGSDAWVNAGENLSDAADALSDSSKEFKEVFDWIEVRLEEINEDINLKSAQLENAVGVKDQNKIIDEMIALNQKLYTNLTVGADQYYAFAQKLLAKIPVEYRAAAQDGTISIKSFTGEVGEETLQAIQDYREWVQKGADATQQAEETLSEISSLAKQAIDNIAQSYENKTSFNDAEKEQLEAYNAYIETTSGYESESIYKALIKENEENIKLLQDQRNDMLSKLNEKVESGQIKVGDQNWYDAINDIAAVDTEIINLKADTANYQDEINNLHWDKFDDLMSRIQSVSDEAEDLIDILGNKDLFDESGNWTGEGITTLGLLAHQMENAEFAAKQYQEEIAYLNKNWKVLGYTEQEYAEKLQELNEGQRDAVKTYHDMKDAIVDVNKERVDAIKKGIDKEIEAYDELIEKKKEALDAEKDAYDFQQKVTEQQKDISTIQRKLAALANDDSASARAQRAQLEADLAEAQAAMQDTYRDKSIEDQKNALDANNEQFKENKEAEKEGWDEYLENTEQVVADSLATLQSHTDIVYETLKGMGKEYGLSITESLTSPWKDGETAIQSYSEKFGLAMSSTVEELQELEKEFNKLDEKIETKGDEYADKVDTNFGEYTAAEYDENKAGLQNTQDDTIKDLFGTGSGLDLGLSFDSGTVSSISGNIKYGDNGSNVRKLQQALNALGFNCGAADGIFGNQTLTAVKNFQRSPQYGGAITADGIVGANTKKKFKVAGYASGTTGVKNNQLSLIDELGEELVMHADGSGRLAFLSKGSAVIPHDISENLMELGRLDPQEVLDRSRPIVSAPHIVNNNIELNMEIAEVVHIDTVTNETLPNLTKIIDKQMDKYVKKMNADIRKYTR